MKPFMAALTSKVLANALFKEGRFVQAFPAFGVERRGAAAGTDAGPFDWEGRRERCGLHGRQRRRPARPHRRLHTPGHSPGCICVLGEGVVFSGDTLFNFGIGRFDMPGGNGHQLLNSIHTKLMVLPDNTVVYPGHGPQTTIGTERQWNPFLRNQTPF